MQPSRPNFREAGFAITDESLQNFQIEPPCSAKLGHKKTIAARWLQPNARQLVRKFASVMSKFATPLTAIKPENLELAIKRLTTDPRDKLKPKHPQVRICFRKKTKLDPTAQQTITMPCPGNKTKDIHLPGYLIICYYYWDEHEQKLKEQVLYSLGAVYTKEDASYLWEQAHIIAAKEVKPALEQYAKGTYALLDGYDDFYPFLLDDGRVHYRRVTTDLTARPT